MGAVLVQPGLGRRVGRRRETLIHGPLGGPESRGRDGTGGVGSPRGSGSRLTPPPPPVTTTVTPSGDPGLCSVVTGHVLVHSVGRQVGRPGVLGPLVPKPDPTQGRDLESRGRPTIPPPRESRTPRRDGGRGWS